MDYTTIDMARWPRRPYYEHYLRDVPCSYSLTVQLDITAARDSIKRGGYKLYPAMLYLLTTCANRHEAFRYGRLPDGSLVLWNSMHPSYTIFHEDDHTFSSIWTQYDADFAVFSQRYAGDQQEYGNIHAFAAKPGEPANIISVSCMPWLHFTAMSLHLDVNKPCLMPIFTIGRFVCQEGRTLLPLAIQVHHAVCDGYHVSQFVADLQATLDDPAAVFAGQGLQAR